MEVSAGGFSELAGGGVGEVTGPLLSETQLSPTQGFGGAAGEVDVSGRSWRQAATPVWTTTMNETKSRTDRRIE